MCFGAVGKISLARSSDCQTRREYARHRWVQRQDLLPSRRYCELQSELRIRRRVTTPRSCGSFAATTIPKDRASKKSRLRARSTDIIKGRKQKIHAGSYVVVPDAPALRGTTSFTVQAFVWPTTPAKGNQGIVAKWSPDCRRLRPDCRRSGRCCPSKLVTGKVVWKRCRLGSHVERHWYRVGASFDADQRTARVFQHPLRFDKLFEDGGSVERTVTIAPADNDAPLTFAAIPAEHRLQDSTSTTMARLTVLVSPIVH